MLKKILLFTSLIFVCTAVFAIGPKDKRPSLEKQRGIKDLTITEKDVYTELTIAYNSTLQDAKGLVAASKYEKADWSKTIAPWNDAAQKAITFVKDNAGGNGELLAIAISLKELNDTLVGALGKGESTKGVVNAVDGIKKSLEAQKNATQKSAVKVATELLKLIRLGAVE